MKIFILGLSLAAAATPSPEQDPRKVNAPAIVARGPENDERLRREVAAAISRADAAFQAIRQRADEAYAQQNRRSASRRKEIEARGGYRRFLAAELKRLRGIAGKAPAPPAPIGEAARLAAAQIVAAQFRCRQGEPVIFDAPDLLEPDRATYELTGCNLSADTPKPPKLKLVLDSGESFELWTGIIFPLGLPGITLPDPKDSSIVVGVGAISGVFDGPAKLVLSIENGKSTERPVYFRAARSHLRLEPPRLQGYCAQGSTTDHCAWGGTFPYGHSFMAYHHQYCCGWAGGTDHYFLNTYLKNNWKVSFSDVRIYQPYTGSSCGPAGGPGFISLVEGADIGSAFASVRIHWNTTWMCSELFYYGVIGVSGPRGTSPF